MNAAEFDVAVSMLRYLCISVPIVVHHHFQSLLAITAVALNLRIGSGILKERI